LTAVFLLLKLIPRFGRVYDAFCPNMDAMLVVTKGEDQNEMDHKNLLANLYGGKFALYYGQCESRERGGVQDRMAQRAGGWGGGLHHRSRRAGV
jgi:hypothetical protein